MFGKQGGDDMTKCQDSNPFISVIMPVYNREPYLTEAVESIINQTYTNFEIILVDDASTDGSGERIRQYERKDQRVRAVFLPHQGLPRTLNAVIPLVRGPFIAFMDSDDIALPERLHVQIEWMKENQIDLCGAQVETFGSEADLLDIKDGITRLPICHEGIVRELLFQVPLWRSALMFKSRVGRENTFDETMACTDCEWPYRAVQKCVTGNVPQVLLKARRHGQNVTTINYSRHRIDATKSHFRYFYSLYPRTPLPDYIALCRVIDQVAVTSLWELERAGQWLVELAGYPDAELRQRMARRWQAACERSVSLGNGVQCIYHRFQEQLENLGKELI